MLLGDICGGFDFIFFFLQKESERLMQSQAIFFYLNKVTHTFTFTPHLLGSEYLYIEFCSNNLTPVCPPPTRNASATLTLSSNTVYLGL